MKRILITSTDVMMYQFILPHVQFLSENGFIVDVACSFAEGYKREGYHKSISEHLPLSSKFYSVDLCRSPYSLKNIKGLNELKQIIQEGNYNIIWTNEPVMGVMTRLAAHFLNGKKTKILYLVHGYQFYRGAPKINWLAYPIEKIMSSMCDAICVINWEDFYFTKKHMPDKQCFHVDGIGLDVDKFKSVVIDRDEKRLALGFVPDDILILSVGELQKRKNHESILKAVAKIQSDNIKYLICGCGELEEYLKKLALKLGVLDKLYLLGHRYDIAEILKCVDIFAHPSIREGLGIAALEAMASGLPLVTSNVQGIKDYVIDGETGFVNSPYDIDGYKKSIETLIYDYRLRLKIGENNKLYCSKYDISSSMRQMIDIINSLV